jgi:hemerythrin
MDKTENMLVFEKIHNDCREIFKGDRALAEKLNEFNDYLNNHLTTDDNGIMRTLLTIGKSFKDNQIVKDNLEFLANKLRTNLNVKFV